MWSQLSTSNTLESLNGVRVRETLPDWILDQAEEVELIDISPHALRQRINHGNIYPPERIDAALNNFFREGNLTALHEMALRRTAEKTEDQLQQYYERAWYLQGVACHGARDGLFRCSPS